jgi:hypothetical protein
LSRLGREVVSPTRAVFGFTDSVFPVVIVSDNGTKLSQNRHLKIRKQLAGILEKAFVVNCLIVTIDIVNIFSKVPQKWTNEPCCRSLLPPKVGFCPLRVKIFISIPETGRGDIRRRSSDG